METRIKDIDSEDLSDIFNNTFQNLKSIKILQIGSNDGVSHDPIYDLVVSDTRIQAHLVEPQRKAFDNLLENYQNYSKERKLFFYNKAITDSVGNFKLYKNIDKNGTDGHSSLLLRKSGVETRFDENSYEVVQGITFKFLLKQLDQNGCSGIDALFVDTEGYDYRIIEQMIESQCYPSLVFFEIPNSERGDDRLGNYETGKDILYRTIGKLENLDYRVQSLKGNIIAILKNIKN